MPKSTVAGVESEQIVKMIKKVIEDNNIPGIDYFEFKQNIESMNSIAIDEKNKYLSTFTILSNQGCTKNTILSSIDTYVGLINKERENFRGELQNEYSEKVEKRQDEVAKAELQIKELNDKIIELNSFIVTTKQEIANESNRIQITEANFNKSIESVIGELNQDKEKITNYIS